MTADLVSMMILYPGKETSGRNDAYPRKDYASVRKSNAKNFTYGILCIEL